MARSGHRSVTWWAAGVVTCLVVAGTTGLGGRVPALALRQSGHWVYNSTIGAVLHVNGASKNVDSTMPLPGLGPGPGLGPADQVVQDDKNGYVIDHRGGRILVFGKSTLTVDTTLSTGTGEQPVSLEVPGGPYLIYPHGGTIVRLGTPAATIAAGGPLATPAATSDGTVWVQRTNTGSLCKLAPKSTTLRCPARVPAGHHGTLSTLDDRPAFVDQAAGSIRPIQSGGLGSPAPVAPGLPTTGQVASSDAGGRLPVVTPAGGGGSSLVLVDTSTVASGRTGAAPITVALGAGQFDAPVTTGASIVLVNRSARQIVTYTSTGARTAIVTVPAAAGTLHVSRGEDGRVYIDNAAGTQTFVVDGDGSVARVDDNGGPAKSTGPAGPPTTPPPGPPSGAPSTAPPATHPPTKPTPPAPVDSPNPPPPSPTPNPPAHPPTPTAQVPDAPATVTASAGDGQVAVNWTTPADNGSGLTSYLVSWSGGSSTVSGGARQTTVSGLTDGTSYVMRVAARNSIGLGPATASAAVTPVSALHAPTGVTATANPGGAVSVSWQGQTRSGVRYTVTTGGRTVAQTTATHATASGLTLGQSYRFTVAASDGTRSLSTTSGAVTPWAAPGAPTGLTATPGKGQIGLTWGAAPTNGSRITGYTVTGGGGKTVTGTSTTMTGLTTGHSYTFTVRANGSDPNGSGRTATGPPSASVTATAMAPPTVTITDAGTDGNQHPTVTFTLDDGGGPTTCVMSYLGSQSVPCSNGSNSGTLTSVQARDNTGISMVVTATNAAGQGSDSVPLNTGNSNNESNIVGARSLPPARVRRRRRT